MLCISITRGKTLESQGTAIGVRRPPSAKVPIGALEHRAPNAIAPGAPRHWDDKVASDGQAQRATTTRVMPPRRIIPFKQS